MPFINFNSLTKSNATVDTYFLIPLAVLTAAGMRWVLNPYLGWQSPFLLFMPAIVICAWHGGFWPGIVATALSAVVGSWLFVAPQVSVGPVGLANLVQLLTFGGIGLTISVLGGLLKNRQQALEQSEERFSLLVQGAQGTAIFFISTEGIIESWNAGAQRIKGYAASEIIGQSIAVFFSEESRAAGLPYTMLEQAKQHGYIRTDGWRIRRDGSLFWAEASLTALYDQVGVLRGFSKMTRDRTEQHELLASLEETEHTARALLESANQAIIGFGTDGAIRLANQAAEAMFGYGRDELIGQPIDRLLPAEVRQCHVHQCAAQVSSTAHSGPMGLGTDLSGHRKDGAMFSIEASLSLCETRRGPMAVCFIADITRRKKIEEDLLRERSQLISILDNSPVLVSIKDLDGNIILANRSLLQSKGTTQEQFVGHSIFALYPPEVADQIWRSDQAALQASAPIHAVEKIYHKDGQAHTYLTARFPVSYLDTAQPFGICAFSMDISEQKKAEDTILHAAHHDALTGLPNRALVYEFGNLLIASAKRAHTKLAVLFFDLDRFKPINDTYGHEIGDRMLQEVARRLRDNVRASDLVGRLGGDEFVAILTDIASEQDLSKSAAHILDILRQPYHVGGMELRTSPSIGISVSPDDGQDIDMLIRHADAAMYHAKESGRNTYQFFTPAIHANTRRVFAIEQKMRHGIEESEFELYYQPIVDTRTRQIIGAEALIRWPQADGGMMMPNEFIQAAEASGIINPLGDWVIEEACRQHQEWQAQGLPPMRIAVNVSPIQFRSRHFFQHVADAVSRSGIDPACLELEVTESTIMKQVDEAGKTLAGLKELGLQISLDDFGTGYSSLSHLAHLPIDKLKVDQSFIRNINTNSRSLAIAETVIALGKRLGIKVVAEGIETEEAFALLRQCQCDFGQGYLLSEPLPADQFAVWHRHHHAVPRMYH